MKNRFIKPMCLLLALVTVFASFGMTVSAADTKKVTSGNFVFTVNDKSATLIEYKGNAESVTVPSKVKGATVRAVGDYAFWQKKNMKSLVLPKTVKSIGEAAFNECTALKEIKMPYHLTEIKNAAFWYCTNLETVLMNKKAKTFGENVFKGCKKLTVYVYEKTKAEAFAKSQADIKTGYYKAEKITASKNASVGLSQKLTLKIKTVPENVYGMTYTYKSSNKSVATVSSKGVVKGVKLGTATITVTTKNTKDKKEQSVKIKVTVKPKKVTSFKVSSKTATSYTLSWAKSAGASAYRIYVKDTKTNKWVKLADTKNTNYTVKNLAVGSSASYRVKAYAKVGKKTYYSPYSNTLKAAVLLPSQVTDLKASYQSSNSISLSWTKVSGVTGYRIYSYNASSKKYTFLADTASTVYTVKNLKPNSTYAYAVKAYILKDKKYAFSSQYSNTLYAYTCPAEVSGLKELVGSSAEESFSVSWNKQQNVTAYEVSYCNATDGKWKTVKVNGNTDFLIIKKLPDVSDYKIKVRALRTVGKATYYGPYSAAINVKVSLLPTNKAEALKAFSSALKNAENSSASYNLFTITSVTGLSEETKDPRCENVLKEISSSVKDNQFAFEKGKEVESGKTLKEIMSPEGKDNLFNENKVDLEKLNFRMDGSGYSLDFYLNDEKGNMFTPEINWKSLSKKYGFTLNEVTYETYIDNAKIQNERFDNLGANITFNAKITFGEETFTLSGTVSYLYLFIW